jgi:hypothetical protein
MSQRKRGRRDYFLTKTRLWVRLSAALQPFVAKEFLVRVRKEISDSYVIKDKTG